VAVINSDFGLDPFVDWVWDSWQRRVLEFEGNVTIRAGRQVGKSEVISEKALMFALKNPGTIILIIAASQRQSSYLFEKVCGRAEAKGVGLADKPTMTKLVLDNGSRIYSYPAGRTGYAIRGLTVDLLIVDEAAFVPSAVWLAVTPMLAVSRKTRGFGWLITISTPFGKGGFFYETFSDPDFLAIHVSSEQCKRLDKRFLLKEKKRMTKQQYAQEYLGEFVDEWHQFFSSDLLQRRMSFIEWSINDKMANSSFYLGVDIARYGGDENAFVIAELYGKNKIRLVKCDVTDRVSVVDTIQRVQLLDEQYGFKRIFVDDAGVGGGVTDVLVERLGRRVVGLNNSARRIQVAGEELKRGILKEDLYSNMLMLLETGLLDMIADPALLRSLKSITYEYGELSSGQRRVKIYGDYAHLAEAAVRACWCIKEKGLDLYIF
jgi:hypothetical protein